MNLITVIIPVYNGEKYLDETINSVLTQTYKPFEIIIIDDGSTDNTKKIIDNYPDIKYIYQENSGAGSARNKGIELANGNYLTFLDADDLWTENKLEIQVQAFLNNPELDMVFGNVQQFISPELSEDLTKKIDIHREFMNAYSPCSMMIKKDSFYQVGYFDYSLHLGEFIDWYLKAKECNLTSLMLPDIVMKRRIHKTNSGIVKKDNRFDYVRIIKASLDRKNQHKN